MRQPVDARRIGAGCVVTELDRVDIGRLSVAYRRAGRGPPLVLLHGAFGDSRIWRPQLEDLSDEFTVVAWDAPGCGRSTDPPEPFTMGDYADCLAGFLDRVELSPATVLGLSWGSTVALALYERAPTAPAALILASAYAGWAGSLPAEEVRRRVEQISREITRPASEFLPDWLPTLLTDSVPQGLVDEVSTIMADFHPAGMRAMVNGTAAADLRHVLPSIEVPTLLLYGEKDVRSPVDLGERMRALIPGADLVVLPESPHLANLETPERFDAAVRRFLRGTRGSTEDPPMPSVQPG